MEIYTREQLRLQAVRLVNAMIEEGPDNEQALHLVLALIDPDPEIDDFASNMLESEAIIAEANQRRQELLDKMIDMLADR